MAKKDFRILIAISERAFAEKVLKELRKTYTVHLAKDLKEFSAKVHKLDLDLVVIDYRFSGVKAEDIYHGIEVLHPNAVFVIYAEKDRRDLAVRLWKRRAFDYIVHTRDVYSFIEEINKCVRWAIQKAQVESLRKKMDALAETVRELSRKIQRTL